MDKEKLQELATLLIESRVRFITAVDATGQYGIIPTDIPEGVCFEGFEVTVGYWAHEKSI